MNNNADTSAQQLKQRRLDLDAQRLEADKRLRSRELDIKEKEQQRSMWHSPIFVAVLAGMVGLLGNAFVAFLNSSHERELERQKSEAALILQALKTDNPDKAAKNLEFLVDTGLITNQETSIRQYLANREKGQGASLPSGAVVAQESVGNLLEIVDQLPITAAWEILRRPPVSIDEFTKKAVNARLGGTKLEEAELILGGVTNDANAKTILKMVLVLMSDRSPETLQQWKGVLRYKAVKNNLGNKNPPNK